MLSKEKIEKAKERIQNSLNDVWFGILYSQEEKDEDEKILLQYIDQLEQENNKLNKMIDEMVKQLTTLAVWDNQNERVVILETRQDIKQYFEKKVEEN